MKALLLTAVAMIAFAANPVLCRLALGGEPEPAIDAWSFTAVRLGSGALTLLALVAVRRLPREDNGSWKGAAFLTLYALPFSFAYLALDTGTGALLLFGAVQLTMIVLGLRGGERPGWLEWVGLLGAAGGVVYLVFPGVTAPDPLGAGVMALAGIGWGLYSVAGKSPGNPTVVTAGNFTRAAVVIVPLSAAAIPWMAWSAEGFALAAASGAVASGCGYAVWYAALKYLPATRAALVQLSVPPIAAAGGVWLAGEGITLRLAVSSAVILGSIGLGVAGRAKSH
jgi:drug/metabolite transporter (DMT)-like permease